MPGERDEASEAARRAWGVRARALGASWVGYASYYLGRKGLGVSKADLVREGVGQGRGGLSSASQREGIITRANDWFGMKGDLQLEFQERMVLLPLVGAIAANDRLRSGPSEPAPERQAAAE